MNSKKKVCPNCFSPSFREKMFCWVCNDCDKYWSKFDDPQNKLRLSGKIEERKEPIEAGSQQSRGGKTPEAS